VGYGNVMTAMTTDAQARVFIPSASGVSGCCDAASNASVGPPILLLVDDDASSVQVLGRMLAEQGELRFALSGSEALRLAHAVPPDLVLIDAEMPGMSGFEFCAALKADPALNHVPVIIITSHGDMHFEVAGFAAGAADFIRKPPVAEIVQARVRMQLRMKALADQLRSSAFNDSLTGLANRRHYDSALAEECKRARRTDTTLALLLLDIDHFKRFNDSYGHPAGDACLQRVTEAICGSLRRPGDLAARWGGEEFAVLLPETELSGAVHVANLVLQSIRDLSLVHANSPLGGVVTVSIGVAAARCVADSTHVELSAAALLSAADQMLYAAKANGRNCLMVKQPVALASEWNDHA
jgi:diguanylate cyclase (GGDEF)-like protein